MERRVVITGMGAITPLGNTVSELKAGLFAGKRGIDTISKFDTADFKCHVAGEVKDFDPLQYFSKPEVRRNDLNVQYACAAAAQAVADSGIENAVAPERLGVYIGSGIGGIHSTVEQYENFLKLGPRKVSPFTVPMMIANMATGTVAIRHRALGPSLPIVTACATSTNAIGEAYRTVKHGYADAIIAGGTEAALIPFTLAAFCSCMALTKNDDPATACRPFDKNRDGFIMGEGAAIVILEELSHAQARGAKIYAEVAGYGNTQDAYHMTAPDPEATGITACIKLALAESGAKVSDGIYVNAHGTSTPLNDKSETLGFKQAFGEADAHKLQISSTKSMTGHMLGAAGGVEALACCFALEAQTAPPTIGLAEPDPECDLNYTPGKAQPFPCQWAMSTNLGFGGHNGCLVFRKMEA